MTFPLVAFTLAGMLIFTAFKNVSVGELLRGESDGKESTNFLGATVTRVAGRGTGGGATPPVGNSAGGRTPNEIKRTRGTKAWKNKDGSTTIIAAWIYVYLEAIGAKGKINITPKNGYRTPAYSESLCYEICGAPSCSGTCAGKSSNHSGKVFPGGAIDLNGQGEADILQSLIDKAAKKGIPRLLQNQLPQDRIHYSNSGK